MEPNLFNHTDLKEESPFYKGLVDYLNDKEEDAVYLLREPLGTDFKYEDVEKSYVILRPGYKIIFVNLGDSDEDFDGYQDDFLTDVGSLANKHNYQNYIGRPKKWKGEYVGEYVQGPAGVDFEDLFESNRLAFNQKRFGQILISLITYNIQDLEAIGVDNPVSCLEKIKKKIVLFDADQTKFIYSELNNKIISVQGLSGTGKTELLLHRLRKIYSESNDSTIFFTCHNVALANTLRERIPTFFDTMQVSKQIKWNERLWVTHAWGSYSNPNSGLYSFLCHNYQLSFSQYGPGINYEVIFGKLHEELSKMQNLKPCIDYMLIDESQDFPKVFFDVCEMVTKEKVYTAGDVFQRIYDLHEENPRTIDITLKRCYRTDPRTLMFAHSIGLGLHEKKRFNWLADSDWQRMGYKVHNPKKGIKVLSRYPVSRPDGIDQTPSVEIRDRNGVQDIIALIRELQRDFHDLKPDDLVIVLLDDGRATYTFIDSLVLAIRKELKWEVTRGHEKRKMSKGTLYVSNHNHVKGLEFPFAICVTDHIQDYLVYRNTLYTMLTRSFLKSFLMVKETADKEKYQPIIDDITNTNAVTFKDATEEEKREIEQKLLEFQDEAQPKSIGELLEEIFVELAITDASKIDTLKRMVSAIPTLSPDNPNRVKEFIKANLNFV
ncbi:MAG: ATP-binding domain-containing protein [Bacteroidales bacterium]|nr:ATP-binding domain-containing protein [Bacteroidales bacterium]